MWSQTSLVVLLTVSAAYSSTDFEYHGDLSKFQVDENSTFANFYLRNSVVFQPIRLNESPEDVWGSFPKCCPPSYSYRRDDHSCRISDKSPSELFEKLDVSVNLLNTVLDCEVLVDYQVNGKDISFDRSRRIIFNNKTFHFGEYCVDFDYSDDGFVVRACKNVDYCAQENALCIKKCCRDGYMYVNRRCARDPTFGMNLNSFDHIIENYNGSFSVYYESSTCAKYQPDHDNIKYTITSNGSLFLNYTNEDRVNEYPMKQQMYCFDGMKDGDETVPILLFCANTDEHIKFQISRAILLTSSIFLLLTITIHLVTSKSRTLMGKIIICHCACMMVAFVSLTTVQFHPSLDAFCKPVAYLLLFSFIATFTWLNVMCYEIWKTFGLMKNTPPEKQKEIFIKYSIYGWSVPSIIVCLVLFFNLYRVLPDDLHPFLGETHCIVENRLGDYQYGHLLFFSLPQALMLLVNLGFFIDTLRHYFKIKKEVAALQNGDNVHAMRKKEKIRKYDLERFLTVVKLFIVMGLSWSFEVLSAVVDFKTNWTMEVIEMIFDTINCLQGVFVFIIFILNRKTLLRIYKKITCKKGKQQLSADDSFDSVLSSEDKQEMTIQPVQT